MHLPSRDGLLGQVGVNHGLTLPKGSQLTGDWMKAFLLWTSLVRDLLCIRYGESSR